ncbi:hypothetical protein PIB30_027521 [Stylosanthes scabra]|uniref:Uncharacterized protein n=1 Tax=Stylosanthes scabra TaxID=79078 RepID=A0ABU6SBI6_9FABA|nr:hypothetical protein [Stylosanthes scabra]
MPTMITERKTKQKAVLSSIKSGSSGTPKFSLMPMPCVSLLQTYIRSENQIKSSAEYNNLEVRLHIQSPVTAIQIQRFLPDAENGEVDWNAPKMSLEAALGTTETEAVHQPPPKPPNFTDGGKDLQSLAHEIGGTDPSDNDEELTAGSGAEVSRQRRMTKRQTKNRAAV